QERSSRTLVCAIHNRLFGRRYTVSYISPVVLTVAGEVVVPFRRRVSIENLNGTDWLSVCRPSRSFDGIFTIQDSEPNLGLRSLGCSIFVMMGYLLHSGRPYILWLAPSALAKHFTIDLYGAGPTATACSARRKKSFPRLREFRRLKRNVNSSR